MATHLIANWEYWKELCLERGEDPYECVDVGIDKGGGSSEDYEYVGELPGKEEE